LCFSHIGSRGGGGLADSGNGFFISFECSLRLTGGLAESGNDAGDLRALSSPVLVILFIFALCLSNAQADFF